MLAGRMPAYFRPEAGKRSEARMASAALYAGRPDAGLLPAGGRQAKRGQDGERRAQDKYSSSASRSISTSGSMPVSD